MLSPAQLNIQGTIGKYRGRKVLKVQLDTSIDTGNDDIVLEPEIHIPTDVDFVIPPYLDKVKRPYKNCTYIYAQTGRNIAPPETDKQESPMRHPPPCFPERPLRHLIWLALTLGIFTYTFCKQNSHRKEICEGIIAQFSKLHGARWIIIQNNKSTGDGTIPCLMHSYIQGSYLIRLISFQSLWRPLRDNKMFPNNQSMILLPKFGRKFMCIYYWVSQMPFT